MHRTLHVRLRKSYMIALSRFCNWRMVEGKRRKEKGGKECQHLRLVYRPWGLATISPEDYLHRSGVEGFRRSSLEDSRLKWHWRNLQICFLSITQAVLNPYSYVLIQKLQELGRV